MTDDARSGRLPIGTVERETGLSKDVLRVWERRYGFPDPARDEHGDRIYSKDQVERLHLLKRLMDRGHRPSRIIHCEHAELRALLQGHERAPTIDDTTDQNLIPILRAGDPNAVADYLRGELATRGLFGFATRLLPVLNEQVGNAWMRGDISVFEEHLYTEQAQNLLRQTLQQLPTSSRTRPRIVLTTLPGEQHSLGLLMAQTLLALAGADVRSFGIQMPLTEIVAAARRQQADIVALSFSAAFPLGAASEDLAGLRAMLTPACAVWAGGAGLRGLRNPTEGVLHIDPLDDISAEVFAWRDQHGITDPAGH